VQDAILATVRFWLDLGVDGYRLDTANFYFHDAELRSNPGRGAPDPSKPDPAVNPFNPYGWQRHLYDKSRPENLVFLQRLRALLDQYPDTTMVGEIGDDDGLARVAEYTAGGDKLHMAYCFDLLGERHDAPFVHGVLERFGRIVGSGWPCWALSNHDVTRVATRWGGPEPDPALLRLALALQASLRGSVCLYQGEELGLPEADVPFEDLQDPYGITMWPQYKGRDGCRTPMPWSAEAPDLGFGSGAARPWLPLSEAQRALAVDRQEADPGSMLQAARRLLHWRRTQPALVHGELMLLPVHEQVLAFVREHQGERVLCAFNLSAQPAELALPAGLALAQQLDSGIGGAQPVGATLQFAPWGVLHARLA